MRPAIRLAENGEPAVPAQAPRHPEPAETLDPFHPDYVLRRAESRDHSPDRGGDVADRGSESGLVSGPTGRVQRKASTPRRRTRSLFGPQGDQADPFPDRRKSPGPDGEDDQPIP